MEKGEILMATPENYVPKKNERHVYHLKIEQVRFSEKTGERLSTPIISKIGEKSFKNYDFNLRKQGFTVDVLFNPVTAKAKEAAEKAAKEAAEKAAKEAAEKAAKEAAEKAAKEAEAKAKAAKEPKEPKAPRKVEEPEKVEIPKVEDGPDGGDISELM